MRLRYIVISCLLLLSACDPNAKAEYGDSGLPKNCRAYVQTAIDGYKAKRYTADEAMAGLERNCGGHGSSWGRQ
jgi:hypothetical protein